jgi:hypothetical protein
MHIQYIDQLNNISQQFWLLYFHESSPGYPIERGLDRPHSHLEYHAVGKGKSKCSW